MSNVVISEAVKYIGCSDRTIDIFESQYPVPNGVSYNSYVILDEKVAVLDTADPRVSDQWLANLEEALAGRTPDYLVVHHLEPDHAGTIGAFLERYPQAAVVGNAKTFSMLPQYFELGDHEAVTVKEGDTLSLGAHTLTFVMAPMVHWPEVMVSYESSEKILFSADGFGKFGALDAEEEWKDEARRYFINIVGKYGMQVQTLLKKAAALDIQMICPLHGPVLKENLGYYIGLYDTWSSYKPEEKGVVIAVASIHGNTAKAAKILADKLTDMGETVALYDLSRTDVAQVVSDAFRYDRIVFAAASYDAGVFLPMEELLIHLRHKSWKNRKAFLVENGSWGPTAARTMKTYLDAMKGVETAEEVLTIRGAVKEADTEALIRLAETIHNA